MNPVEPAYQYRATLIRVIDGDTYEFDVDLGFKVHHHCVVRLRGFYAPELTEPDGKRARERAEELLKMSRRTVIVTSKTRGGVDVLSFSRWVADVYTDGELFALRLLREGYVKAMKAGEE